MIKFVKGGSCVNCCFDYGKVDCMNNPCEGGHYIKRTRPRKSRDRRLLEALLNDADVCEASISGKYLKFNTHNFDSKVTDSQMKQLIAIKESMQRKWVRK